MIPRFNPESRSWLPVSFSLEFEISKGIAMEEKKRKNSSMVWGTGHMKHTVPLYGKWGEVKAECKHTNAHSEAYCLAWHWSAKIQVRFGLQNFGYRIMELGPFCFNESVVTILKQTCFTSGEEGIRVGRRGKWEPCIQSRFLPSYRRQSDPSGMESWRNWVQRRSSPWEWAVRVWWHLYSQASK